MLFLFDIDGTLLRRMPPAHRQALCDAASAVYGVRLETEDLGQTAGLTDTAIARRMLRHAGVPEDVIVAGLPGFFNVAARAYERHVPTDLTPYHTPHAEEALARLRERDVHLGLVTGNIERVAWIKLAAAGLAEYFACGAFGDEAEAREELPPRAVERASRISGYAYAPDEVYVVGDTPADIACGAASCYRTIAVATGPIHSLDALRACGPDYVLEDLGAISSLAL
jgi:phosphoglycolate phosphatase